MEFSLSLVAMAGIWRDLGYIYLVGPLIDIRLTRFYCLKSITLKITAKITAKIYCKEDGDR